MRIDCFAFFEPQRSYAFTINTFAQYREHAMKRTLLCAALATSLSTLMTGASTLHAQTVPPPVDEINYTVNMSANIGDVCAFSAEPVASEGENYFSTITGSDATFEPETDPNGAVQNVIGELKFTNAVCTQATHLSLSASKFLHQGTATPGFSTEIIYSVQVDWGGTTLVPASEPVPINITDQSVPPTTGELTLKIVTEAGTAPLNQGSYVGTIGLTLSAV